MMRVGADVREARIVLVVSGFEESSAWEEIEAVIDTGFTGHLSLPSEVADRLRLPSRGSSRYRLADGGTATLRIRRALVHWSRLPLPGSDRRGTGGRASPRRRPSREAGTSRE